MGYKIYYRSFCDGHWDEEQPLTLTSIECNDQYPSAVIDDDGVIWVFWRSDKVVGNSHIYYKRCVDGAWDNEEQRLTDEAGKDHSPAAVKDTQGDIWVFWESKREGTTHDIYYKRYVDGNWGPDRRWISDTQVNLMNPSAVTDPRGVIWLYWRKDEAPSSKIYYSTIYSSI